MRRFVMIMTAALFLGVTIARGQATQPAAAGEPPAKETKISDAAKAVLEKVREGYAKLKTLEVAGVVSINLDAGPEKEQKKGAFTASYKAPTSFVHEMKDDMLIVNNAEKAYLFKIDKKMYIDVEAPKERVEVGKLPDAIGSLLQQQNPSILFALVDNAAKGLSDGVDSVDRGEDVTADGTAFQSLVLKSGGQVITVLVDPKTGLLRQMKIDLKEYLISRNVPNVNAALLTIEYTKVIPDGAVEAVAFNWTPPADATLVKLPPANPQAATPGGEGDAMALVGKEAPVFALKDLEDKPVALGDLKGKVVVLDFWATWCGPCVQAMPHLAQLNKDMAGKGVQIYAVNLKESIEQVKKFLETEKIAIPVLMDNDAKVAELYKVSGIPQTVVIGKDGNVARIFVGFGPGGENQLREAVEASLK